MLPFIRKFTFRKEFFPGRSGNLGMGHWKYAGLEAFDVLGHSGLVAFGFLSIRDLMQVCRDGSATWFKYWPF